MSEKNESLDKLKGLSDEIKKISESFEIEDLFKDINSLKIFEEKRPGIDEIIDFFSNAAKPLLNKAQRLRDRRKELSESFKIQKD